MRRGREKLRLIGRRGNHQDRLKKMIIQLPSLSCEFLKFFDEEVRRFFTCIAADIPDDHWKQAQLSLSFGGLGFRSLSYHSCAAFISSLSSSGFGSASNRHLLSAISKFNALVFPTEAITLESVLSSPLSQHALCKKEWFWLNALIYNNYHKCEEEKSQHEGQLQPPLLRQ